MHTSYREAVEGLIDLPEAKGSGWLAVVDEVHTVSARQLRQLAAKFRIKPPTVQLPKNPVVFDYSAARSFFSDGWVPVDVTVDELMGVMPKGVVSWKAWRVGVSPKIVKAFEGGMATRVASTDGHCLSLVEDGGDKYLASILVERRIHVCHCREFGEKGFCQHLLVALFHFHEAILELWGDEASPPKPSERLESFRLAQQHQHRRTMLCNWLYYFTKECYAKLEFKAGRYRSAASIRKAIKQMGG